MSRRALWPVIPFLLLIQAGASLRAQPALAGSAITISPPPSNFFYDIALAGRPGGGFVAVWQDSLDIFVRGYDGQGRSVFPVRALGQANGIDVATLGSGFVVVGFHDRKIYPLRLARIYDAAGLPQSPLFQIETPASSPLAAFPRVTALRSGGFTVAWVGHSSPLAPEEVFLRRFSARGVPRGEPLRVVRTSGAGGVCCVDLVQGPGGEVLVVWLERDPYLVWGQLYGAGGGALGSPFQISTGSSFRDPVVAAGGDGFFVAWHGRLAENQPEGIHGRLYDRAGRPRGEPFSISPEGIGSVSAPVLAADAQGRVWAAWLGGPAEIQVREMGADGSLGAVQGWPSLWRASTPLAAAGWGDGHLAVAWERMTADYGLSAGLVAQRFSGGESPGVLQLRVGPIATAEGDGSVTLEVERREGTAGAVSVDYTVRAESATEGVDFVSVSGTIAFAEGDSTSRSLTVPVLDDALAEDDETFVVELSLPTGGARLGSLPRCRVEIRDDDVPSPLLRDAGAILELDSAYDFDRTIREPLVAALAGGGFVAIWKVRYRFDAMPHLAERIYDAEGGQIAKDFSGFVWTMGVHLAAQPGGGFTIVNAGGEGEFGRRFDPRGQPRTEMFALPWGPVAVAAGRAGGLLALWTGQPSAGTQEVSLGVFGKRGQPLGALRRVHSSPACRRTPPALASDSLGRAVVAWLSTSCGKILVRRSDAAGRFPGAAVDVIPPGAPAQIGRIAVAAAPDGRFVVVWEGDGDGDGWGIFARLFDAGDRPAGPVLQVHSRRRGDQVLPRVAMQRDGRFLVIWQDPGDLVGPRLFGQYFAADGARLGSEFPVDSEEPYAEETEASLATDAEGRYVAAWRRAGGDTLNLRRFRAPR